jgi:hypothetical protein
MSLEQLEKKYKKAKPIDKPERVIDSKTLQQANVVSGDFARTMMPKFETPPQTGLDALESKRLKKPKSAPFVVNSDPKRKREAVKGIPDTGLTGLENRAKQRFLPLVDSKSTGDRILEMFESETAQNIFTTLGADEHAIVGSLSKLFGDPEKKNIGDYTWTNFMLDRGAKDDWKTSTIGIASSILLSPSTYLTFGAAPGAKLVSKGGKVGSKYLTKKGRTLVNKAIKTEGDAMIKKATEAGNFLKKSADDTRKIKNAIRDQAKARVETNLIKRLGDIQRAPKMLTKPGLEVDEIFSKGGVKFLVPFTGGKELSAIRKTKEGAIKTGKLPLLGREIEILSGKKTAFIANNTIVPLNKALRDISSFGKNAFNKEIQQAMDSEFHRLLRGKKIEELSPDHVSVLRKQARKNIEKIAPKSRIREVKNQIGKAFVLHYGIPKKMVKTFRTMTPEQAEKARILMPGSQAQKDGAFLLGMIDDAAAKASDLWKLNVEDAREIFKGMTDKEIQEFTNIAHNISLDAAFDGDVAHLSKNTKVLNKVKEWFGLDEFKGSQLSKLKEEMWEQANKIKIDDPELKEIIEKSLKKGEKLDYHFPGVHKKIAGSPVRIGGGLSASKRGFLKARTTLGQNYSENGLGVLATRMHQLAVADLEDALFESVIKKGLGGVKPGSAFTDVAIAAKAGYVPFNRPINKALLAGDDIGEILAKGGNKADYWIKAEVGNIFKQEFTPNAPTGLLGILMDATNTWKLSVTRLFPSFHSRNFNSNIVMNSMRIGRHAFNPKRHKIAYDMVYGRNLKKVFKTQTGHKLTIQDLIDEANKTGVFSRGEFQFDIAGESLSTKGQRAWNWMTRMFRDPLSPDFKVTKNVGWGQAIENQARAVNYLHWRMKGLSPKAAAWEVNEALFDYGAITNFEKILNQSVIPFYTFSKKNIVNHMKVFAHRPGNVINQLKFLRDIGPTEGELREDFPDWLKKKIGVTVRGSYLTGFGIPIENVLEFSPTNPQDALRTGALMLNPMLRFGLETPKIPFTDIENPIGAGKDFFSGRMIEEVNNANEFKWLVELAEREKVLGWKPPKFVSKGFAEIADWLDLERDATKPEKIIGNPDILHFMRSTFTSRFQSTLGQLSKEDKTKMEKSVRFMTGWMRVEPDPSLKLSIEKYKSKKAMEIMGKQTNLFRRNMGFGNTPYFVGGDKFGRTMANWYMTMIMKSASIEEVRRWEKEFEQFAKDERELRGF